MSLLFVALILLTRGVIAVTGTHPAGIVDPCLNFICENGGSCIGHVDAPGGSCILEAPYCSCPGGFEGEHCEIETCNLTPCLVDPCVYETCPRYPHAECRANYCDGCNADFFIDGVYVNCTCPAGMVYEECGSGCGPFSCDNLPQEVCPRICTPGCYCPDGLVVDREGGHLCINPDKCHDNCNVTPCFADPCGLATCPRYPDAECRSNYCDGCHADFYVDGLLVDCHPCPAGMVYEECGSGCGPFSCDNLPQEVCPRICTPGCYCPDGLVVDETGNFCIQPEMCLDNCNQSWCGRDPCSGEICPQYPHAECRRNYCDGCHAEFYVDGLLVDCHPCPAGMVYEECGSGCGPFSCDNLPQEVCPRICTPGCYCPDGLVVDETGNFCIQPEMCLEHEIVRLVGGISEDEGRVEVFHNGEWGTVCDDHWDLFDADVVCTMLGYDIASDATYGAYFGQGTGSILLDDVACLGHEESIFDCPHRLPIGEHNCAHSEDAGVVCTYF